MLDQEFQYYIDHQEELVNKYNGKVLVIIGENVAGVYNTEIEAYLDCIKKHELGTFLIQQCSPGKESYTQTFHTRAIFA